MSCKWPNLNNLNHKMIIFHLHFDKKYLVDHSFMYLKNFHVSWSKEEAFVTNVQLQDYIIKFSCTSPPLNYVTIGKTWVCL